MPEEVLKGGQAATGGQPPNGVRVTARMRVGVIDPGRARDHAREAAGVRLAVRHEEADA
jgi:hypothetical protein